MLIFGRMIKISRRKVLATITDIGTLIIRDPKLRGGRPIIAGTGTSVVRIAALYKQGYSAEEIAADKDYLMIVQVYAALTYYHARRYAKSGGIFE